MGINTKGRRKLEYCGKMYYWNVRQDAEDLGRIGLNIVSEDKKFIVLYHLAQADKDKISHIVVKGMEFVGLKIILKKVGREYKLQLDNRRMVPASKGSTGFC